MQVTEASETDALAWDEGLASRDLPPSASWEWREILVESYGTPRVFLLSRERAGMIVGQLALYLTHDWRRRLHMFSLRHGFIADNPEAAAALTYAAREIARARNAISLTVTSGTTLLD